MADAVAPARYRAGLAGGMFSVAGYVTLVLAMPALAFITPLGGLYFGDAPVGVGHVAFALALGVLGYFATQDAFRSLTVAEGALVAATAFVETRIPYAAVTTVVEDVPARGLVVRVDTGREYGIAGSHRSPGPARAQQMLGAAVAALRKRAPKAEVVQAKTGLRLARGPRPAGASRSMARPHWLAVVVGVACVAIPLVQFGTL